MSNAEKARYIVTNQQNQPVELHVPSGLVVLPPRGRADISPSDLSAPQLLALRLSRLVMIDEVAVTEQAEAAARDEAAGPQSATEEETRDPVPDRKTRSTRKS